MYIQFRFWIGDKEFNVENFSSRNFKLSEDYMFTIHCHNNNPIKTHNLLNTPSTLQILNTNIYGITTKIRGPRISLDKKNYCYTVTIRSPINILKHTCSNRVFTEENIESLCKKIWLYAELSG